jgi:CheY-like chemotaxis protein
MINDILDISKIEAGRFELAHRLYETAPLLSDTLNLNRVRIGDKPVTLKLEVNGDFPAKLVGDELRVRQILNNLLSNAIKYTREGTVTLNVLCETMPSDGNITNVLVRFTVQDTGIGIRAEDMEKLFTSYTRLDTKTNRKIEGTGLGLTITKKLVEMMCGSISVKSEYGSGSAFTAQIVQGIEGAWSQTGSMPPCIGKETAEALRNFRYTPTRKETVIARLWLPDCKVLVADDRPNNLHVARGLLTPYGLQIDTAVSGHEAVEKARAKQYDLILMDRMMPEMDGTETVSAIRKLNGYAHTPIIAWTVNALRAMKKFYLEEGFDGYLSKPIESEALDEIITKYLGDRAVNNNSTPHASNSSFLFSLAVEEKRLDKINHFNTAFQSGLEIDSEYYRRFTSLVETFDKLPGSMQADKELLIEAGRHENAQKICEILPAFCQALKNKLADEGINNFSITGWNRND